MTTDDYIDDPETGLRIPTRGARPLAMLAGVCAVGALFLVPVVLGVAGMGLGTISHVKGDRWGMKAAVAAGIAMVIGMSLQNLLFGSGGVTS